MIKQNQNQHVFDNYYFMTVYENCVTVSFSSRFIYTMHPGHGSTVGPRGYVCFDIQVTSDMA